MLRMRHARPRIPAIFYLYVLVVLAMTAIAVTSINHI